MEKKALNDKGFSFPLLEKIESPADIRSFTIEQLTELCDEMRRFLIHELSSHPGHFASSMGAIEITVALHYVFDTPRDRVVWDVGHQAYGHKLLTGRAKIFDTIRQLGGLSGFPNPAESEYDTFTAGHASNSISAALGMSVASQLTDGDHPRNVVAVIGDAAISGGLAFEGINNAANTPNNLLIILNDNDMSIDHNVGSLNSYLAHITTSKSYNALRYKAYKALKKVKLVSENSRGTILRFNNSLKSLITHEQNIFEGLNIRYFGPFDGHDLQRIIRVLRDIKDMQGPRILHLRTVKGKGYEPAEKDPSTWHAPGKFNEVTGERIKSAHPELDPMKYQDIFGRTLVKLARENDKIVSITAAMPSGTSVSMMQKVMPERTFDVGISEGHAVTFAGGLAKDGMHPFVAIYSSFLQRGYDHIIHDVALQGLPVTFCLDRAGIVGEDGATHHGVYDLSYLRSIPGLVVASPRNEVSLSRLMYTAARHQGPMAVRYPRGAGKIPSKEVSALLDGEGTTVLPIGRGEQLHQGKDLVILTVGPIADDVATAIERAEKELGVTIAHYDMIYVKPLDHEIIKSVGKSGVPVITAEDGTIIGGLGAAVMEALNDEGYHNAVYRIGVPDEFIPQGSVAQLHKMCGMDADAIYEMIKKALKK